MSKRTRANPKAPQPDQDEWNDPLLAIFDFDDYALHAPPNSKLLRDKLKLLRAYIIARGVATNACRLASLPTSRFKSYMESDVEFKRAVDDIRIVVNDWVESQLFDLVHAHSERSVHFYLKSRHPNYADKLRLANSDGSNLVVRWADE